MVHLQSFTITVNPTATVTTISNQTICNSSSTTAVSFSSPTIGGTITYTWTNDTPSIGFSASGTTDNIPSFVATNTGLTPVTATITVTPHYTNNSVECDGTATTFTITVNPSPTLTCPDPIVVYNDPGTCGASVPFAATITGTPTPVITYSLDPTFNSQIITSGYTFPIGTTTVYVQAVNECGTVTCHFTVTVNDDEAPVITGCPPSAASLHFYTGSGNTTCDVIVAGHFTPPSATDCSPFTVSIHVVNTFAGINSIIADALPSGYTLPVGTTHLTYTFTDSYSNSSSCSFDIVVTDNTPPTIDCSGDITICSAAPTGIVLTPPAVTDNCGVTTPQAFRSDGLTLSDPYPIGQTTITWGETDIHGNFAICTQNVTVNPQPQTPVIGANGATTFCQGGSVTLSSSASTGNQWYKDGIAIGGAINQTLLVSGVGVHSYLVQVTTGSCISNPSNAITVTVNPTPATPSITFNGPTTFCDGGSVQLSSSAASGNQWQINGVNIIGATSQTYTASVAGTFTDIVISGSCPSAPSNSIVVTVNSLPPTPVAGIQGGGSSTICQGNTVTLTSDAASGNQWYRNGFLIPGATSQTYTTSQDGSYLTIVTGGGCPSAPSNAVVITVNPTPVTPVITTGGPTSFCNGGSVLLTSSATSGNQWYKDGIAIINATLQTYTAGLAGSYTVVVTSLTCSSAPSNPVVVTIATPPSAPIVGTITQPTCSVATGSVALSGLPSSGAWAITQIPGNVVTSGSGTTTTIGNLAANSSYTFTVTQGSCTSDPSAPAGVNAQPPTPLAPLGSATQTICNAGTVNDLIAIGTNIKWYDAATAGNLLSLSTALVNGNHYYASQTNGSGCESSIEVRCNGNDQRTNCANRNCDTDLL